MDLRAGAEAIVDRCVVVTESFVSVREPRRVAEGEGRRKEGGFEGLADAYDILSLLGNRRRGKGEGGGGGGGNALLKDALNAVATATNLSEIVLRPQIAICEECFRLGDGTVLPTWQLRTSTSEGDPSGINTGGKAKTKGSVVTTLEWRRVEKDDEGRVARLSPSKSARGC